MKRTLFASLFAAAVLIAPTTLTAQEHAAGPVALDEMVVAHAATDAGTRAEVEGFLARPEIRSVAQTAGIDILRAETAVAVMNPEDLRNIALRVDQIDAALAGGETITVTTTAIIIGLLVLIVLLIA